MNEGTDLINFYGIKKADFDWEGLGFEFYIPYLTGYFYSDTPEAENWVEFTFPVHVLDLSLTKKRFNEVGIFEQVNVDYLREGNGVAYGFGSPLFGSIPKLVGYKIKLIFKNKNETKTNRNGKEIDRTDR